MDGWLEVACVEVGVAERSAVGGGEDEVVEVSASARQVLGPLVSESSGELDAPAGVGLGWDVQGWHLGAVLDGDASGWSTPTTPFCTERPAPVPTPLPTLEERPRGDK